MGEKILSIGEQMNDTPENKEAAEKLFTQYAEMVDGAEKYSEEVCRMYEEIFYDKKIGKNEVYQSILKNSYQLLSQSSDKINSVDVQERSIIISKLIFEIRKKNKTQEEIMQDFIKIYRNLTTIVNQESITSIKREKLPNGEFIINDKVD
jgi:hypothetical protein